LHNPQVESICRKYLELRYRMLPYLYSTVHECATTGMPVMRALWLHYPGDQIAIARADEYLWGRHILVAPVIEKGATTRSVYLPRGYWYDFWTNDGVEGAREINKAVDLETIPLFVAAGTILPFAPVKQYTAQDTDQPLSILIYPGADGSFLLYEDDGRSFDYRRGQWMGTRLSWNDAGRALTLSLEPGSRMLGPLQRTISVKLLNSEKSVEFDGKPTQVKF
jgi:alpha-glucosidase (family GH31 glycosyl hydrolase)